MILGGKWNARVKFFEGIKEVICVSYLMRGGDLF